MRLTHTLLIVGMLFGCRTTNTGHQAKDFDDPNDVEFSRSDAQELKSDARRGSRSLDNLGQQMESLFAVENTATATNIDAQAHQIGSSAIATIGQLQSIAEDIKDKLQNDREVAPGEFYEGVDQAIVRNVLIGNIEALTGNGLLLQLKTAVDSYANLAIANALRNDDQTRERTIEAKRAAVSTFASAQSKLQAVFDEINSWAFARQKPQFIEFDIALPCVGRAAGRNRVALADWQSNCQSGAQGGIELMSSLRDWSQSSEGKVEFDFDSYNAGSQNMTRLPARHRDTHILYTSTGSITMKVKATEVMPVQLGEEVVGVFDRHDRVDGRHALPVDAYREWQANCKAQRDNLKQFRQNGNLYLAMAVCGKPTFEPDNPRHPHHGGTVRSQMKLYYVRPL